MRLQTYFDMLLSIKGMYALDDRIDRASFNRFIRELRLDRRYPGFQAIQFVRVVPEERLAAFTESVADPLGELLARYARTRGPFTTADAAARFGLGLRIADDVLSRMALDSALVRGEFTGDGSVASAQWCDAGVLRMLRRRSLAALRAQVEPVSTRAYARFLPAWQQVGGVSRSPMTGMTTATYHVSFH